MYANDRFRKIGQERPAEDIQCDATVSLDHRPGTREASRVKVLLVPVSDRQIRYHLYMSRQEALALAADLRRVGSIKLTSEL